MHLRPAVGIGPQRARGANGQLERPLNFDAIGGGGIELRRKEDHFQDFANVAVGLQEGLRYAIYQRGRRIIRDDVAHELGGDELRGGRLLHQYLQHGQAVAHTATGGNFVAEHDFLSVVMYARIEKELAGVVAQHVGPRPVQNGLRRRASSARSENRPAREAARDFLNVLLHVTAIDAQRVQFH